MTEATATQATNNEPSTNEVQTQDSQKPEFQIPTEAVDFVGDGKKYNSVEDALKSVPHAQKHIQTLESELATLKEELTKRKTAEELLDELKSGIQQPENTTQSAGIDQDTITNLLNQTLENREKQAQEDSPWLYNSAMFGAGFVPVGAALKGASMAGKIGRSAGMAALNAYGNSGQDEKLKDVALNVGLNAAVGGGIGYAVPTIGKTISNTIEESPFAKRLAATVQNKVQGRTLFGITGENQTKNYLDKKVSDITKGFTSNIEKVNSLYPEIYGKATADGVLVNPVKNITNDAMQAFSTTGNPVASTLDKAIDPILNSRDVSNGVKIALDKLKNGKSSPTEVNNLLKDLKKLSFDSPSVRGFVDDAYKEVQLALNKAVPEIQNQGLREKGHFARALADPFLSKAENLEFDPSFAKRQFSDLPDIESANSSIKSQLNRIISNAGESKVQGANARAELFGTPETMKLQEYTNLLEEINKNRNLGLNINTNLPNEIQNLSYLRGALRGNLGSTTTGVASLGAIADKITQPLLASPYWLAEKMSNSQKVRDFSSKLLSKDPKMMQEVADALATNPKTKGLSTAIISSISEATGRVAKPTNILFQVMQNPVAKNVLGLDNKEAEDEESR